MPPVKALDRISEKWARMSRAATPDYQAGIESPSKDWANQTKAAAATYKAAVTAAANAGRFEKGVAKSSTAKWQEAALKKGVNRWAEGINLSQDRYTQGFEPFRRVIESTTLGPRGPKNSPQNYERSKTMGMALHEAKLKQTA